MIRVWKEGLSQTGLGGVLAEGRGREGACGAGGLGRAGMELGVGRYSGRWSW